MPKSYIAVRNLRTNWKHWDIVTPAEAAADLRQAHVSVSTLARIADRSATSIRRLKVIDQLSPEFKARIRAGEPSGSLSRGARALRLSRAIGIAPMR
jgi:hypothetical protein